MLVPGQLFPNFKIPNPDGGTFELYELRKKEHALLLFVEELTPGIANLLSQLRDEEALMKWLELRPVQIKKGLGLAPEGVEWGDRKSTRLNSSH